MKDVFNLDGVRDQDPGEEERQATRLEAEAVQAAALDAAAFG